jgi:hypothetical protein
LDTSYQQQQYTKPIDLILQTFDPKIKNNQPTIRRWYHCHRHRHRHRHRCY